MKRTVVPEILDHLAHDDPDAIRARSDLQFINTMMGNHRWFRRQLRDFDGSAVFELGAGSGDLLNSLNQNGYRLAGLDFAPRPANLADAIEWVSGDIFETLPGLLKNGCGDDNGVAVIANLFLHHFDDNTLPALGEMVQSATRLYISEPYRSRLALTQSAFIWPFVNRVTRHDMPVSIRAGFRPGDLPRLLGLDPSRWTFREELGVLGACRLVASREP